MLGGGEGVEGGEEGEGGYEGEMHFGDRKRTTMRWSGGRKGTASQYR